VRASCPELDHFAFAAVPAPHTFAGPAKGALEGAAGELAQDPIGELAVRELALGSESPLAFSPLLDQLLVGCERFPFLHFFTQMCRSKFLGRRLVLRRGSSPPERASDRDQERGVARAERASACGMRRPDHSMKPFLNRILAALACPQPSRVLRGA